MWDRSILTYLGRLVWETNTYPAGDIGRKLCQNGLRLGCGQRFLPSLQLIRMLNLISTPSSRSNLLPSILVDPQNFKLLILLFLRLGNSRLLIVTRACSIFIAFFTYLSCWKIRNQNCWGFLSRRGLLLSHLLFLIIGRTYLTTESARRIWLRNFMCSAETLFWRV